MSATIDQTRLEAFLGTVANEVGAAMNTALVAIGDRLGLYRAMADSRPVSAAELAARTSTHERYVREWLNTQAASGFVTYDPAADHYTLPPEQALVLADEASPVPLAGLFQSAMGAMLSFEHIADRFTNGDGFGWHEHHDHVFHGIERFFAGGYRTHLVAEWIPALEGVEERLAAGASVADVGCGHGASTIVLAEAFPASTFTGYDYHDASIAVARERAAEAGVADRVSFEVADAEGYPAAGYDLIATFDALHDMGDPVAAARHARSAIAEDGTWLIVEPFANDRIEDNLDPLGRVRYGFSTLLCLPGSLSQPGRLGLGTCAGPARLTEVIRAGGFSRVRVAAETPFNLILEARP
jgi:SAM-dependent methyltransferase